VYYLDFLQQILRPDQVLFDEPLKNHTTFKIGGPADAVALPDTMDQICKLIAALRESDTRYMVIGNGSNLLFSDKGYRGVIVKLSTNFASVSADGSSVRAYAGAALAQASQKAAQSSLSGLEFACGIPGTVGGGVFMNAGAYGGEIKDVFAEAQVLSTSGDIITLRAADMEFAYRHSRLQSSGEVLLTAEFQLAPGESAAIKAQMDDLNRRRREKQPLDMPSAGSTFKRPEGYYVGKLITDSNLRGFAIGGAQVSETHAGCIVNRGGATCVDVLRLIEHIQTTVQRQFGVLLHPEVRLIPER
jgi:UDP-N-acetylmuramate dehydrogenase